MWIWVFFMSKSSVTDKVQDFEILNFFLKLNLFKFFDVLLIVILRKFLLDLTFWIMWRKFLIKKKEMYLTIFISTRFLLLLLISSPQHWQTWYLCGKKCLDVITRIVVILQMMKHLFWSAQTYLLLRMKDWIHHLLFC